MTREMTGAYQLIVADVINAMVNVQDKHKILTKKELTDVLEIFTRAIYSKMDNDFRDSKNYVESQFIEAFNLTLDDVFDMNNG
tara:strand:+ start:803 stop:1051 length:249 start_codon:yes stop_codon:yes gene_type:complete